MIKAKELRIGNWVDYKVKDNHVQLELNDFEEMNKNVDFLGWMLKPIPLTEEWLIKFGFVRKDNNEFKFLHLKHASIQLHLIKGKGYWLYKNGWIIGNPMKYVHQLQNLYFALTSQELVLKD